MVKTLVPTKLVLPCLGSSKPKISSAAQNCAVILKKSQHGCVRWALSEHITTPPCHDLACGGLEDNQHKTNPGGGDGHLIYT